MREFKTKQNAKEFLSEIKKYINGFWFRDLNCSYSNCSTRIKYEQDKSLYSLYSEGVGWSDILPTYLNETEMLNFVWENRKLINATIKEINKNKGGC